MKKETLNNNLREERENFLSAIDGLTNEELILPGVCGEWSVKDIMAHITAWEAELVKLLWQVSQGGIPTTVHFTNPDVDQINAAWYARDKARSLELVTADFQGVRNQTIRRVLSFSEDDLNDPGRYSWSADKALWQWIVGDSSEHEAEHIINIIDWRENQIRQE